MADPDREFREFARSRAAPLHRSAYLLCGDWHLAQDLVQETLAKAFRNWRRVQRADSPDAYVKRILINEANQRHRSRNRHPPVAERIAEPVELDASDDVVRRAGLLQALLTLPLRQRATIVLRFLEGMSERQTAAVLGCSEGTVKSQTSRALASLRTYLDRTESRL